MVLQSQKTCLHLGYKSECHLYLKSPVCIFNGNVMWLKSKQVHSGPFRKIRSQQIKSKNNISGGVIFSESCFIFICY